MPGNGNCAGISVGEKRMVMQSVSHAGGGLLVLAASATEKKILANTPIRNAIKIIQELPVVIKH